MTWFAHKMVIFDILKDVKAWGSNTEKFKGETREVLRNIFFPLGLHSSPPLRHATHNNEHRLGIHSEIILG